MENPGEMLRRAIQNRKRRAAAAPRQEQPAQEVPAVRTARSAHSAYAALMRSHDRMGTRHAGGKG